MNTPDQWIILKIPGNYYKVFGVWVDGYLGGDQWKLNSGINKITEDDEYYYFYGYSGSCYNCHKAHYGITSSYGLNVLYELIIQSNNQIEIISENEFNLNDIINGK